MIRKLVKLINYGWKKSVFSFSKRWFSGVSTNTLHNVYEEQCKDLPKLPLPSIEKTMDSYSKYLRVLMNNEDEIRHVQEIIGDFSKNLGPKLQMYLLNKRELTHNWAYEYWLNDMYLSNHACLPVNSNPGMVLPPKQFQTVVDVAKFVARILDYVVNYKILVDNFQIPNELSSGRSKNDKLCMAQAYRLLSSYRYPGITSDTLISFNETSRFNDCEFYVIAICRNQLYYLPLLTKEYGRLSENEICSQVLFVLNDAPSIQTVAPVGILTAASRSFWALARDTLMSNHEINKDNLQLIEKSLMVVCLDEPVTVDSTERDETNMLKQMLHGCGSEMNSSNRWFDKTIELIVSNDGVCGLCYEHSPAEAPVVIKLIEEAFKTTDTVPNYVPEMNTIHKIPKPKRLEWILEQNDYKNIENTALELDSLINDLDIEVYRFNHYGKTFIKNCKISPDVYVQLALQLAYYTLHGKLVSSYESASTRRFRFGRVDNIRSATLETNEWVKSMCSSQDNESTSLLQQATTSNSFHNDEVSFKLVTPEQLELYKTAVKKQTEVMYETINGQGIDIHLLGLYQAAKETLPTASNSMPSIFTDPSYKLANEFRLSTSQVATCLDSFMGYGPVVPNGYGVSYNIKDDMIIFCISAFHSSNSTSAASFKNNLEYAFKIMQILNQQEIQGAI